MLPPMSVFRPEPTPCSRSGSVVPGAAPRRSFAVRRPAGPRAGAATHPAWRASPGRTNRPGDPSAEPGLGRDPPSLTAAGSGPPDDEPAGVGLEVRAGPRLVGAHLALELGGRPARVEGPVLASERPRERRAARDLRPRRDSFRAATPAASRRAAPRRGSTGAPRARAPSHHRRAARGAGRRSAPCRAPRPCASA